MTCQMVGIVIDQTMDDFWSYIENEIQNWEFRIEDILLHSLSGMVFAISIKIKKILKSIKSFF